MPSMEVEGRRRTTTAAASMEIGDAGFVLDLKVHEGDDENEKKNRMLVNTDANTYQLTFMRLAF